MTTTSRTSRALFALAAVPLLVVALAACTSGDGDATPDVKSDSQISSDAQRWNVANASCLREEGIDVGVAIPPLGSSTALRDAGAELTFGDFVNQTEYQNVAIELNKLAAADVYGDLDLTTMIGSEISVVGGTTWVSKTGGEVTHVTIVPVSIEVGS